ncbi:MAG TPA: cytochrome c oxidase subunit II [Gaiellaceae bacterium]|nr:cytochrome c oxidase subunit II [Gaiellaceae bacterium]
MASIEEAGAVRPGDVPHGRRFLALWLVLSAIATPLVAVFLGPAIPPGNGSAQATEQVFDNQVMVSVVTPVCILVVLFLVYALVSFRARGAEAVDGPPVRGDWRIQILWVVVTTSTVLFLAGFGTYELLQSGSGGGQGPTAAFLPPDHGKAMDVQVIAQQWEFTFRYPTYGGVETPHLVLPANTLVRLHVTSLDAVHSFWAYQLGVKADANPGSDNVVYVQLKGPRTFEIHCAELCGLWHGYMFDTGRVVPQREFASWIAQQQSYFGPVVKYLPPYSTHYLPDPQLRAG